MPPVPRPPLLPPAQLAQQLSTLDLLQAIYCADGELVLSDDISSTDPSNSSNHIASLREWLDTAPPESSSYPLQAQLPSALSLLLALTAEDDWQLPAGLFAQAQPRPQILLDISLPLRVLRPSGSDADHGHDRPPRPILHLRQPPFLSRAEHASLVHAALPASSSSAVTHTSRGGTRSLEEHLRMQVLEDPDSAEGDTDDLSYVLAVVDRVHSSLRALAPTLSAPSSHPVASSTPTPTPTNPAAPPSPNLSAPTPTPPTPGSPHSPPLVLRTWHLLPSLSTRSKRAELVSYAQSHSPALTGFVLAGKPGLVVLECALCPPADLLIDTAISATTTSPATSTATPTATAQALASASASIDAYWGAIKSLSWADIPSSHKKVSERLREVGPRAWGGMTEVTRGEEVMRGRAEVDDLGTGDGKGKGNGKEKATGKAQGKAQAQGKGKMLSMGGQKGNRHDLGGVEAWLEGLGVGGRLERVLGAEWG